MVQRADSARVTAPFQVTPMLLTALVAAVVSTVLLAVLWYVGANPGPPPPPPPGAFGRPPPRPPGSLEALVVAVGIFATAWVSVIIVACRDQILRRIDHAAERFTAATLEFAEQREQEGIFRGMHLATSTAPGSGGSGPGGSGGGHVVPFPRPSPPPATSDD